MTGYIYAFIKNNNNNNLIAKVQMFMFGLTCFKARKAKTIAIFFKYTGKYIWFHVRVTSTTT